MSDGTVPKSLTPGQMKDLASAVVQGIPSDLTPDQATALIGMKGNLTRVIASILRQLTLEDDPIIDKDGRGYLLTRFQYEGKPYKLYIGSFYSIIQRFTFCRKWLEMPDQAVTLLAPCSTVPPEDWTRVIEPEDFKGFMPIIQQIKPAVYLSKLIQRSGWTDKDINKSSHGEIDMETIKKLRNAELDPIPPWHTISSLINRLLLSPEDLGYRIED